MSELLGVGLAVAALRAGAADYVIKDVSEDFTALLRSALEDALLRRRLQRENEIAQEEIRLARDRAEAMLREAKGVAKEKVRVDAGAGFRAVTLRTIYHAERIDDPASWGLAYGHYKQNPEFMAEFHALIQRWADRDAKSTLS